MPALTAKATRQSRNPGAKYNITGKASTQFWAGGLVMRASTGIIEPAAASASNLGCCGVCLEDVLTTASGGEKVEFQEGEFLFAATSITVAAEGVKMFAPHDNAFDETDTTNLPVAGICTEYVSTTSGWLKVGLDSIRS